MAPTRSRGQSSLELILMMIVLSTLILGMYMVFDRTRGFLKSAQLSEAAR